MEYLLYGANGYTAGLVIEESLRQGMKPVLAGRNRQKTEELAQRYDLKCIVFGLNDPVELDKALKGFRVLLNCAGPFIHTAKPLVEACIRNRVHYLDITGEIPVFELVKSYDKAAKAVGVGLMSGVGFDVVPTDCAARYLHSRLPSATHLKLAFASVGGSISHGTMLTMVENLGSSGAVRQDGKIIPKPIGHKGRLVDFGLKTRFCMTIPWGDISTAFTTTGIPNIETYTAVTRGSFRMMKLAPLINPILRTNWVKNQFRNYIHKNIKGPTSEQNEHGRSLVWGEVSDSHGNRAEVRLEGPEGYKLTAVASVYITRYFLANEVVAGYHTPAGLLGFELFTRLPGTVLTTVD
jgi:short subunit dehydrogenase-like uncharacterized protein